MIPIEDALRMTTESLSLLSVVSRPLSESVGYVLAAPVSSMVDLPPFDQSAMDGYAVVQSDLCDATSDHQVRLSWVGEMAAGVSPDLCVIQSGQCARIFTGGPVPSGATAVVRQEDVVSEPGEAIFRGFVEVGNNIRRQGEELRAGTLLVNAGQRVTPAIVAALSAAGITTVQVRRKPSVAVLVTGDEIVQAGDVLPPGAVYDANTPMLQQYLMTLGAERVTFSRVEDSLAQTKQALQTAIEGHDIVVTTGGVSVGDKDFVIPAAQSLGVEERFWRIRQKPGKPVFFGVAPNGVPVLGLPGNPAAVLVGTVVYLARMMAVMEGVADTNIFTYGVLSAPYQPDKKRDCWVRCTLRQDAGGRAMLTPLGFQASHMLSNLGQAHVLAWVPASDTQLPVNTLVKWVAL